MMDTTREPGQHPFFDDQRTTAWHSALAAGLQAAQARGDGGRVLVLVARRSCGGSRALIERTLPKEEIGEFLNAHFVCVAADADQLEPQVAALLAQAPRREPTPVCLYVSAAGQLLHSTVGGRPAAVFLRDLTEAQARPG